ncbi:MAG: cupredoxin domain-containing protein [Acidimicrobiales bacterium]
MNPHLARLAVAATLLLAACGGDDDDGESGESTAGAGVGAHSSHPASGAPCSPVGEELEGDASETVAIQLEEYSISPSTLELDAGVVTFAARNAGGENHELAFLPGGGDVPVTSDGKPYEAVLVSAGAFELEAFGSGLSCRATFDMKPGTYTLFCVVTSPDGRTHYDQGMRGQLVVR